MERKQTTWIGAAALSLALAILSGCAKVDEWTGSEKSVRITAGINDVSTRTVFGEEVSKQLKINWVLGDCFTVYSDKAKHIADGRPTADYIVQIREATPSETMKDRAIVDPVDHNGLQWGPQSTEKFNFYALYPADESAMASTKATAELPASPTLTWTGLTGKMDMKYAFMYASAKNQTYDTEVRLDFYPYFTAYEFWIDSGENTSVSLSSFSFGSASQAVAGPFEIAYADDSVTALNDEAKRITVDLTGMVLNQGEILKITVFALPQDQTDLDVTVSGTEIGTRKLKLNSSSGTPLVFAGKKLHRILGISFPILNSADSEELLWDQEAYGEDIAWDVLWAQVFSVRSPSELAFEAGTAKGSIASFKQVMGESSTENVPWSIEGYYSDAQCTSSLGGKPAWITSITSSGSGSSDPDGEEITITYAAASSSTVTDLATPVNNKLQAAPQVGSASSFWNLSNPNTGSDEIVETANTYIINAPGFYRFPLVAGNGIKNGELNPSAYNKTYYQDYKGQRFSSPFIHKTNDVSGSTPGTPTTAFVVWEEELFLDVKDQYHWILATPAGKMSAITTTGSGSNLVYWVNFHIDKENMKQGCAVIGVRDENDEVMWSWTIWMTDYIPSNYKEYGEGDLMDIECTYNASGSKVTFMPVDLGWVHESNFASRATVYAGNQVYVRFQQEGTGKTAVMRIKRPAFTLMTAGSAGHGPLYQWGRKDPMLPSLYSSNTNVENTMTAAGGLYPDYMIDSGEKKTVGYSIQHPWLYLGSGQSPLENGPGAVWWGANQGNLTQQVVKTIYDPCPAGYAIPRGEAFLGFRIGDSGQTPNSYSYWTGGHYLWNGYRDSGSASTAGMQRIMLPHTGHRSNTTNWGNTEMQVAEAQAGFHWTAVPRRSTDGRDYGYMCGSYSATQIVPQNSSMPISFSTAVRPVRDE